MKRWPQAAMLVLALADLVFAWGFYTSASWATVAWPWTDQPLDYILLASFLAAGTAAVAWIAVTAEWSALTGALLDIALMNGCTAAWLWARWAGGHDPAVALRAAAFTVFTLGDLGLLWTGLRTPQQDTRPADGLLKASFAVFAVVLVAASTALLLHQPIWPWPLSETSSTLFGLLFLGSAVYFLHGLARPSWHNMKGQLVAFLAYDLVLVQPYLGMAMGGGYHVNWTSLYVYWAVILYSSGLAVWYLFVNPKTRGWAIQG
jgi:hypothetical protein